MGITSGQGSSPVFLQEVHEPNWFQRHLNWTWILSIGGYFLACFIGGVILGLTSPEIGDDSYAAEGIYNLIAGILWLIIVLPASFWVIDKKGRSGWWILTIGALSPLWLSNIRKE